MRKMTLKRVLRYMSGAPRMVTQFPWEPIATTLVIECDSDFAGCLRTRKSTTGGAAFWGRQFIKAWSKTLLVIALSTGEAELAAIVRASREALGLQSVLKDMGRDVSIEVHSDATAAIGIVKREGLGRVRHLVVADPWVQQKHRQGEMTFHKLPGKDNSSDLMTKGLDAESIKKHLIRLRQAVVTGRPKSSPTFAR
jgi:hypothetical protein